MEKNKDEIEVRELFSAIREFFLGIVTGIFNFLINSIIYLKKFIKKNFLYLIIGGAIGGGIGIYLALKSSPVYETNLTISSPYLKGYNFIYEIEKLDDYFKEKNYEVIANILSVPEEEVKPIRGIYAETYANYYNIYERYGEIEKKDSLMVASEMNASMFIIKINLTSKIKNITKLEQWIVNYLANNKILKKNYEIRRDQLAAAEQKLFNELQSLDSLKAGVNNRIINGSKLDSGSGSVEISLQGEKDVLRNPIEIYDEGLKLFNELQSVQRDMRLLQEVSVINGAKSIKENKSRYLIKNTFYGAVMGFLFTCLVILISIFNKYLVNIEKSKN